LSNARSASLVSPTTGFSTPTGRGSSRDAEFAFSAMYPDGPIIWGLEAWRSYADSLPWGRSLKLEPERFVDVDDERVLVLMRGTAEGESSGVRVERRTAHEITIRNGVVVRLKVYGNPKEALEAAGLSE
jgi:hypothetical protein